MNATDERVYLQDRRGSVLGMPDGPVSAVAVDARGHVWAATPSGPYEAAIDGFSARFEPAPEGSSPLSRQVSAREGGPAAGADAVPHGVGATPAVPEGSVQREALDEQGHRWTATDHGVVILHASGFQETITPADGLPMPGVRGIALGPDGARWFALPRGVARLLDGEWRYFAGKRWLPDDTIDGIAPDGTGGIFVATRVGLGWIAREAMTLEGKTRRLHDRLRARHRRRGYVSACALQRPGDPDSFIYEASDNDGLWTALYVAAECFRYAVTGAEDAKANARDSMEALVRLEAVTPIPGFPARAMVFDGERVLKSDPEHGEWHAFSGDPDDGRLGAAGSGEWKGEWKGDTSSDELDGHFFACAVVFDMMADPEMKAVAAAHAERLADHLLQNDFNLVDLDGRHTRWGFFSPAILNTAEGEHQRGLNSLEILSHLKTAFRLTGEERFQEAYLGLVRDHHYALNVVRQKIAVPGHVNHSDDELAFLAYYPLLRYETAPDLLALYRWSLRRSWEIERPERSPFLNFLYGAAMGGPCDADVSRRMLEEIPLDTIHWRMENSHRFDLERDRAAGRFAEPQATAALSPAERAMLKWNGNPYRLDDGSDGRSEEDGVYLLLPYWMGRAFGFI